MQDRLWFFTAGRLQNIERGRTTGDHERPVRLHATTLRRYEGKGTYSVDRRIGSKARTRASTEHADQRRRFTPTTSMDLDSLYDAERLMDLFTRQLQRHPVAELLRRGARTRCATRRSMDIGAPIDRPHRRHAADRQRPRRPALLVADVLRRLRARGARQPGRLRQGLVLPVDERRRLAQPRRSGTTASTTSGSRTTTSRAATTAFSARRRSSTGSTVDAGVPRATARRSFSGTRFSSTARARTSGRTRCSSTTAGASASRLTANLGLRCDKNDGVQQRRRPRSRTTARWSPRLGIVWDPTGERRLVGDRAASPDTSPRSTNSIAERIVGRGQPGYLPVTCYAGPSINAGGAVRTPTPEAIAAGVRLVLRQRRRRIVPLTGRHPIHRPGVTPQIRRFARARRTCSNTRRASAASSAAARRSAPTSLPRLPRLLRVADRHDDRQGDRQARTDRST